MTTRTITIDDDEDFQRIRKTLTNFLILPERLSDEQHADLCRLESLIAVPRRASPGVEGVDAAASRLPDQFYAILDALHADTGYLFGRVAVDGSCSNAMVAHQRKQIEALRQFVGTRDNPALFLATPAQYPPVDPEEATIADYQTALESVDAQVRNLDVLLNGESGAARQARLCDLVGQVESQGIVSGWRASQSPTAQDVVRDAERWRHIDKFGVPIWDRGNRCYIVYDGEHPHFFGTLKEATDAAIDAAREVGNV